MANRKWARDEAAAVAAAVAAATSNSLPATQMGAYKGPNLAVGGCGNSCQLDSSPARARQLPASETSGRSLGQLNLEAAERGPRPVRRIGRSGSRREVGRNSAESSSPSPGKTYKSTIIQRQQVLRCRPSDLLILCAPRIVPERLERQSGGAQKISRSRLIFTLYKHAIVAPAPRGPAEELLQVASPDRTRPAGWMLAWAA